MAIIVILAMTSQEQDDEPMLFTSTGGNVMSAVISSDGKKLMGVVGTGETATWDLEKGTQSKGIAAFPKCRMPNTLVLSPDGKHIAGWGEEGLVLWDGRKTVKLAEPTIAANTRQIIFSPDGKRLAIGMFQGPIAVFEVPGGKPLIGLLWPGKEYRSLAFSRDGRRLAAAGDNRILGLFDLSKKEALAGVTGQGDLSAVVLRDDGKRLIAANQAGEVVMYDGDNGKILWSVNADGAIRSMALSLDDKKVVTLTSKGKIQVWDAQTGAAQGGLLATGADRIVLSPDSNRLLALVGERVFVWDLRRAITPVLAGHRGTIGGVVILPGGKQAATAAEDGLIKVWDLEKRAELRTLKGHGAKVTALALSPDGKTLASASEDKTARLWDPATGRAIRTLSGHTASVFGVAFASGGSQVVTGSADRTLRVWNAATGAGEATLTSHKEVVRCVAASPDGSRAASASVDGRVLLWDASTWKDPVTVQSDGKPATCVAFSADGKSLFWAGGESGGGWSVEHGTAMSPPFGLGDISSLAFDAERTAVGCGDGPVRLFSSTVNKQFSGHAGAVTAMAFAPALNALVTGGADGSVRVWRVPAEAETPGSAGHPFTGDGLFAVSADGSQVAFLSRRKGLTLWAPASGQEGRDLGGSGSVYAITFRDAKTLVGLQPLPNRVIEWNLETGELVAGKPVLEGTSYPVLSADGRFAAAIKDEELLRQDLQSGETRKVPLKGRKGDRVAISHDGKYVVAVARTEAAVFEANTGREVTVVKASNAASTVGDITFATTADVMTIVPDGKLEWLSLPSLSRVKAGLETGAGRVAFRPDGKRCATALARTIRVWDPATGKNTAQLTLPAKGVTALALLADGRVLYSDGEQVKLWTPKE
jgi:WD40 repeat protein